MDREHFDALARAVGGKCRRRIVASVVGAPIWLGCAHGEARKKQRQ
jgi:hypothetical protein